MPNLNYRSLRCIKHVKLKIPHSGSVRHMDSEGKTRVVHYLEGDAQIGRVMVGYLIEPQSKGHLLTASFVFGRMSDRKATRELGRKIALRRYEKGLIYPYKTVEPYTSETLSQVLKLLARNAAKDNAVGWFNHNVILC